MSGSEQIANVKMNKVRETKGAVLYENVDASSGQAVTNLYLRKEGMTAPFPEVLDVQITSAGGGTG